MANEEKDTIVESPELLPPEGHPIVGPRVFELLGEVLEFRENLGLPAKWNLYYNLRRNKHWDEEDESQGEVSLLSANLLGHHHQKNVNALTDNHPTFEISQAGDLGELDAKDALARVHRTLDFYWADQEQQHVLECSVSTGETYGSVCEKAMFSLENNYPAGEVEIITRDPFYFAMYPKRCKDPQKALACFDFQVMSVREARQKHPKFADVIQPDREILEQLSDERLPEAEAGQKGGGLLVTISNAVKSLMTGFAGAGSAQDENTLVVEAWVRDHTVEEDGNFKYPGRIRRVTTCNGGNLVLEDRGNPSINADLLNDEKWAPFVTGCYLYDRFPFSWTHSVTDPDSPFGMADYEQLRHLQIEVNKTISQLTLYKDEASAPKIINPRDTGVSNDEFDNYPGIINPTTAMVAQGIRYMDSPKSPVDLAATLNVYTDLFFKVAGTFDLESAQSPGREVVAYKAIAALLENAVRMLKGKIRNYSKMIRERGRMTLSLMQNYYLDERWISFKQDDEDKADIVKAELLRIPVKVAVVSGSTMPKSQVQRREEALALYKMQAIDQPALLQAMDFPNWREIVERTQAGIFGVLFGKLEELGWPPELLKVLEEIAKLDEGEFEKALEKGELPTFEQIAKAMIEGGGQIGQDMTPADQAEIAKIQAEIQKLEAEAMLTAEKITTERVEQMVKQVGVTFDEQKLAIERAKVVNELKNSDQEESIATGTRTAEKKGQGPFRGIKGVKSDNQNVE